MTAKHSHPHFSDVKNHPLSRRKDVFIFTLLLLTGLLQPAIVPVFASSQLNARNIETNTPLSPSAICPASISFGETIQCSIDSPGETDIYTFSASAGDKVRVRMSQSSGTLYPGIKINKPDGTMLCQADNMYSVEIASCPLPNDGTYSLLAFDGPGHVGGGTSTGDYYLFLQRLNNPGNTVPFTFGQTLPGSITTPAEIDTYTFSATAGDKVLIRMSTSSGALYPGISVYAPDGTLLCDDDLLYTVEIESCALPATGSYSVLAFDGYGHVAGGTSTGGYYIFLQRLNNPGNTVPFTFGQTLPGSIPTPTEMDTYTFSATSGDKLLVRMSRSSGSIWSGIRVYAPDGSMLCEDDVLYTAEISSCALPTTGLYSVLAFDGYGHVAGGTSTGGYYIFLQRLNNPGSSTAISSGQTLPGSIDTQAEMDTFTFSANTGDNISIKMNWSSGTLWPGFRVYGPDGSKLCDEYDFYSANVTGFIPTSIGTFTILAFDGNGGTHTGNYSLFLSNLNHANFLPLILK
jgi:hypothetical protein